MIQTSYIGLLTLMLTVIQLQAQNEYSTTTGVALINGNWGGENFKTEGIKTEARLNYETARLTLRPLASHISTGIDSLNRKLKNLNLEEVRFEGKLNIDIVQTQDHPLQTFEVEGRLLGPGWSFPVHGKGSLEHTYYETYACMLSISLHVELKDQDSSIGIPQLDDGMYIQLQQSVLRNE